MGKTTRNLKSIFKTTREMGGGNNKRYKISLLEYNEK